MIGSHLSKYYGRWIRLEVPRQLGHKPSFGFEHPHMKIVQLSRRKWGVRIKLDPTTSTQFHRVLDGNFLDVDQVGPLIGGFHEGNLLIGKDLVETW